MDTAADVGSTPASESFVAIESTVIDAPEPAAPSHDEDLRAIWDKDHPPRENGRFVAKNPTESATEPAAPVTEVADQTAEKVIEQAPPSFDAPSSWSAEMKAKLASLPPEHADVIKYAAQRDKEQGDAITRAGQQIKAFEPIRSVIEQHAHTFRQNGLHPAEALDRMMNVNARLEAGPESAKATIYEMARAYKVDLQGDGNQDASPADQRIAELEARLARQETHLTEQQRQKVDADNAVLAREIADFANDTKNPRPHFESVRKVMAGLMSSGAAETMQDAYEQACFANPTIRQSLQLEAQKAAEDKRKADEADRVKKAKAAAGVNVRSSPGQSNGHRTMEDDMRAIWQKNHGSK